ncbi:MAG: BON domain-containing protein [Gaiellales bacterium]
MTLTGIVPAYLDKLEAESAAKRVKSVKAVANQIEVRLPTDITHTDTDVAQRAVDTLRWRSGIPACCRRFEIGPLGRHAIGPERRVARAVMVRSHR